MIEASNVHRGNEESHTFLTWAVSTSFLDAQRNQGALLWPRSLASRARQTHFKLQWHFRLIHREERYHSQRRCHGTKGQQGPTKQRKNDYQYREQFRRQQKDRNDLQERSDNDQYEPPSLHLDSPLIQDKTYRRISSRR